MCLPQQKNSADIARSSDTQEPGTTSPAQAIPDPTTCVQEYNFEDRHGTTFPMSFEDIKRMLRDDPDDGQPPGLWAQDHEAYYAKQRAKREIEAEKKAEIEAGLP